MIQGGGQIRLTKREQGLLQKVLGRPVKIKTKADLAEAIRQADGLYAGDSAEEKLMRGLYSPLREAVEDN